MSDEPKPAFEITDGKGRHYRIFADGRTEGFEDVEPRLVINRIPQHARDLMTSAMVGEKRAEAALNFRHIAKHLRSKAPDPRETARLASYLDDLAARYATPS